MMKKVRGTKTPITLRRLLPIAAVLLVAAVLIAPATASYDDAYVFSAGGEYSSAEALATALGSAATFEDGAVKLLQDIKVVTNPITITGDIIINGNEKTIYRGSEGFHLLNVISGTLTLGDNVQALTIHGYNQTHCNPENMYGLILVNGVGAHLIMNEKVTLTNSDVSKVTSADTATGKGVGAAVRVIDGATFVMNGGTIKDNKVNKLGAVLVRSGGSTFTMNGGTISDNTAINGGAGIYVGGSTGSYGLFTLNRGEITRNHAGTQGGGIFVSVGNLEIKGGTINNNYAGSGGGGVYFNPGSSAETFTMTAGIIEKNNAVVSGGGVYYNSAKDGNFQMSGGSIKGNEVKKKSDGTSGNGGGIHFVSGTSNTLPGTLFLSGSAEIIGNTAENNGGGVNVPYGHLVISDSARISGNDAPNGGGVRFSSTGSFTMSGSATISENTASTYGAGVYQTGGEMKISGSPTIIGNTLKDASTENNVYLPSGKYATLVGELTEGASIGVTTQATLSQDTPAQITTAETDTNYYEKSAQYFLSDKTDASGTYLADTTGVSFVQLKYQATKYYKVTLLVTNAEANMPAVTLNTTGQTYTATIIANEGCRVPATITAAGVTYTPSTDRTSATVSFTVADADVTISVACTEVQYKEEHYKQTTDGTYSAPEILEKWAEVGSTVSATDMSYAPAYSIDSGKSVTSGVLVAPWMENGNLNYLTLKVYYNLPTITYYANGGAGTMEEQIVPETGTATLAANAFTYEGYTFNGWNTASDGTGASYADKATVTTTANIKLYANWTLDTPTVKITADKEMITVGETVTLTAEVPAHGAQSVEYLYQWYSVTDNVALDGKTTATITVTPNKRTVYNCTVIVKDGATVSEPIESNTVTIDVWKEDTISDEDAEILAEAMEGEFKELFVKVEGIFTANITLLDANGKPDHTTVIKFTVNYPSAITATNYEGYDFVVLHLNELTGKVERVPDTNVNPTRNGLEIESAVSPFVIGYSVKNDDTNNGGSSTPQGSSVWLTETQAPTETPTPSEQPTDVAPTDLPTTQPTEQPKSPLSVLAVLAGLGAVAVLRRK